VISSLLNLSAKLLIQPFFAASVISNCLICISMPLAYSAGSALICINSTNC
jgi:hypothetical protein